MLETKELMNVNNCKVNCKVNSLSCYICKINFSSCYKLIYHDNLWNMPQTWPCYIPGNTNHIKSQSQKDQWYKLYCIQDLTKFRIHPLKKVLIILCRNSVKESFVPCWPKTTVCSSKYVMQLSCSHAHSFHEVSIIHEQSPFSCITVSWRFLHTLVHCLFNNYNSLNLLVY